MHQQTDFLTSQIYPDSAAIDVNSGMCKRPKLRSWSSARYTKQVNCLRSLQASAEYEASTCTLMHWAWPPLAWLSLQSCLPQGCLWQCQACCPGSWSLCPSANGKASSGIQGMSRLCPGQCLSSQDFTLMVILKPYPAKYSCSGTLQLICQHGIAASNARRIWLTRCNSEITQIRQQGLASS